MWNVRRWNRRSLLKRKTLINTLTAIMTETDTRAKLWETVATATRFCIAVENAREADKGEFIAEMLGCLPRIYLNFTETGTDGTDEIAYLSTFVDEDYYESIRRGIESLLGPDDTYLETFEEDMKYSETPIAASVAESLADIFQDLFNFVGNVKESDGEALIQAFAECKDNFDAHWSQTLCNVMRPLNQLRLGSAE